MRLTKILSLTAIFVALVTFFILFKNRGIYPVINKQTTAIPISINLNTPKYVSQIASDVKIYDDLDHLKKDAVSTKIKAKDLTNTLLTLDSQVLLPGDNLFYHFKVDGHLQGYIAEKSVTFDELKDLFFTVTEDKKDTAIYQDSHLKNKRPFDLIKNQTYQILNELSLSGKTYYTLYNSDHVSVGFINKHAVNLTNKKEGLPTPINLDITLKIKGRPIYKNFEFEKQDITSNHLNKTFKTKELYYHSNGQSYYDLYDQDEHFLGYINTKDAQPYEMKQLLPSEANLLALTQIVQQKILDLSEEPAALIDDVLNIKPLTLSQVSQVGKDFLISVNDQKTSVTNIFLTPKEIAKAVNQEVLPIDERTKLPQENVSGKKMIALTFDDGPGPETPPKLLSMLKEKNVTANFFMLGQNVKSYPQIAKNVAEAGHSIGSHSYSHPDLTKLNQKDLIFQANQTDKEIYLATGKLPQLFRPPYGAINPTVAKAFKKPIIQWSLDTMDWKSHDPKKIKEEIKKNAYNGAVVLLHDIHKTSVEAVPDIIDQLRKDGYEFVSIETLLSNQEMPLTQYFDATNHRDVK